MKIKTFSFLFVFLIMILYTNIHTYDIVSNSMSPTLIKGDVVLCDFVYDFSCIYCNDIVFFNGVKNDTDVKYVKRIKYIYDHNSSKKYYMQGDNTNNSYDSRSFGWISRSQIIGKVKLILWSWDEKNNKLRTDRILKKVD